MSYLIQILTYLASLGFGGMLGAGIFGIAYLCLVLAYPSLINKDYLFVVMGLGGLVGAGIHGFIKAFFDLSAKILQKRIEYYEGLFKLLVTKRGMSPCVYRRVLELFLSYGSVDEKPVKDDIKAIIDDCNSKEKVIDITPIVEVNKSNDSSNKPPNETIPSPQNQGEADSEQERNEQKALPPVPAKVDFSKQDLAELLPTRNKTGN